LEWFQAQPKWEIPDNDEFLQEGGRQLFSCKWLGQFIQRVDSSEVIPWQPTHPLAEFSQAVFR
jgi:hypothetical protein